MLLFYKIQMSFDMLNKLFFVTFSFILLHNWTSASDYSVDSRGYSERKTIKFSDNSSYVHFNTTGWWSDSKGNYGKEICFGKTLVSEKSVDLDLVCELTDQNGDKIRVSRKRNSLVGGGVGVATYLDATKQYEFLIGKKCTYAVTHFSADWFYKQQCSNKN